MRKKGSGLLALLIFSLFTYWCQRVGCMHETEKPQPIRLSIEDRTLLLSKLTELKTNKAPFTHTGRYRNQILDYEILKHITASVRRLDGREDSRYFRISFDEWKISHSVSDYSPTGSLLLLCETKTDSITIGTTYEIQDGPLQGDYLLTRQTIGDSGARGPYGYIELFNLSYIDGPFGYTSETGIVYECLKRKGILGAKPSQTQEEHEPQK